MRNLSFRGYAQGKGFDPLKVPDETWKLQDETERTLRGMQAVRSQNLQNRNEQLEQLRSNARKEEQQRNLNFNLEQEFKRAYHDAEMQHYKTRILDQDTKIREARLDAQRFDRLKELAPKTFLAIAQFQNQRFEAIQGKARSIDRRLEEQLGTEQYDAVLAEVKKGKVLKEVLRQRHPSYKETIDDSLNSWEMIAVQRHMLKNHFNSTIHKDLAEHKQNFERNGTTYNKEKLNEDLTDPSTSTTILDSFYEGKMDQFQQAGFSASFLNKELRPLLDEVISQEKKVLNTRIAKNKERLVSEKRGIEIIEMWDEGGQDIMNIVNAVDDKKSTLDETFHFAEFYARTNDEYGMNYWSGKFNEPIIIKGKETTIAEEFPNRVAEVYAKANERYEEGIKQHKKYVEQAAFEANIRVEKGSTKHPDIYQKAIDDILAGENVTMADLEQSNAGRALIAGSKRTIEEYETDFLNEFFKAVSDEKGRFTIQDISIPTLTMSQKIKLFPKTLEGQGISETFDSTVESILKKNLRKMANQLSKDDVVNPQIDLLLPFAKKDFYSYLFSEFDVKNAENITDKDGLALLILNNYSETMEKRDIYKSEGLEADFKFTYFGTTLSDAIADRTKAVAIINNISILDDKDTLTKKQDRAIVNYAKNGGEMPSILFQLNQELTNFDPIAIANMRLRARGLDEIERKGLDSLFTAVDPKYRHLMTHRPSFSKTIRALNLTLEETGDLTEGNKAIYEAFISKDIGSAFDKPYEVLRTPNGLTLSTDMGLSLESTTIGQAINLLSSGRITSLGAYDLNVESLLRAKTKGIANEEDTLNAALQLDIFRNDIEIDTSFLIIDKMDEPIPGMGQYNVLPFNYEKKRRKKSRGISQKQMNERFNKNIENIVKVVDKKIRDDLKGEGEQIQFLSQSGEFLIDRIKKTIQATKEKKDSGELKETSRGLRPTETRKIVNDTRTDIFAIDFAAKGFNYYQFTDVLKQEMEGD